LWRDGPPVGAQYARVSNACAAGEVEMTSTIEQESINEALALIDKELVKLVKRDLIATIEVADLLLDVRALLSNSDNDDKPN
jgi:hypothetical protein